ncbi:MAG: hypothetical protein ACRDV9_05545 [Acidimicrobiia bacterium]
MPGGLSSIQRMTPADRTGLVWPPVSFPSSSRSQASTRAAEKALAVEVRTRRVTFSDQASGVPDSFPGRHHGDRQLNDDFGAGPEFQGVRTGLDEDLFAEPFRDVHREADGPVRGDRLVGTETHPPLRRCLRSPERHRSVFAGVLLQVLADDGDSGRADVRLGACRSLGRYVEAAEDAGVVAGGGEERLTDLLVGEVCTRVRPARPAGRGAAWEALVPETETIRRWLAVDGLNCVKVHELLCRKGITVPYRTLHRFVGDGS